MEGKVETENHKSVGFSYVVDFTWRIDNFSTIITTGEQLYSNVFSGGEHKWRILIYPKEDDKFSMYLNIPNLKKLLPQGWTRNVKFRLSLVNTVEEHTLDYESSYTFKAGHRTWGCSSFIALNDLCDPHRHFLVNDSCTVRAKVWFNEEPFIMDKVDPKQVKSSAPFTEIDTLFTDIQNGLQATAACNYVSGKEISDALKIFKICREMDLVRIVQSGKGLEFKSAISLLLAARVISEPLVDEITTFVANFSQYCENFEATQRFVSEAREDEESVGEVKTTLKQLTSKFIPVRNQAEVVNREIGRMENLLMERKAKRARLGKRLEDLAEQATTWKHALFNAEQRMKMSTVKKEEAEKAVGEFRIPWESLQAVINPLELGANLTTEKVGPIVKEDISTS